MTPRASKALKPSKFWIGLIAGLLLLFPSAAARAQHEIEPRSTSPFQIARAINQGKKNHTDEVVNLDSTWEKLRVPISYWGACGEDCQASVFRYELNGLRGEEVVVKITRSLNDCRYLVFTRRSGHARNWKLLGYIDHDFNRYEMSRQRVAHAFGRNWLVIRGQEGSGSGYSLYSETWYQVTRDGVRAVLNYPIEGHTAPWPTGVGWEFKAQVASSPKNVNRLVVRYKVTYTTLDYIQDHFQRLFANAHHAYYARDPRMDTFTFDPRSDISEAEIQAIAGIESEEEQEAGTKIGGTTFYTQSEATSFYGGGYEVFLKYNSYRLMKIATGKDATRKQWLREVLKDCKDTKEKISLLEALRE